MRRWMALLLLMSFLPIGPEGAWYIRVVARDDTPAAQAEKLALRDALLPLCPASPRQLPAALPRLAAAARAAGGRITVRRWAPAGHPDRPTLYITLGEGRGHNWWGVLYEDAPEMAGAENAAEADQAEFVWPWWTWLMRLLGF